MSSLTSFPHQLLLKVDSSKHPIFSRFFLSHHLNLPLDSVVNFKKRNKISLTVLSGPHVHKKSREQFHISHFTSLFCINFNNVEQYHNFLAHKQLLLDITSNQGYTLCFTYSKNEIISLNS